MGHAGSQQLGRRASRANRTRRPYRLRPLPRALREVRRRALEDQDTKIELSPDGLLLSKESHCPFPTSSLERILRKREPVETRDRPESADVPAPGANA